MKLFELVQNFDAEVLLHNDSGTKAEASSVIGLLMLDSAKERMIEVEVTRPDEVQVLAAAIELFNAGLTRIDSDPVRYSFSAPSAVQACYGQLSRRV